MQLLWSALIEVEPVKLARNSLQLFVVVLCFFGSLAESRPVAAQQFLPASLFAEVEIRNPGETERFHFGALAAHWQIQLPATSGSGLRLRQEVSIGPLLVGDYRVNRNFSIGAWWNRIDADVFLQGLGSGSNQKLEQVTSDFWNVHVQYHFSEESPRTRGLTLQLGYSGIHQSVSQSNLVGGEEFSVRSYSPNIWLGKTQQVCRPMIFGANRPITIFASAGYYFSSNYYFDSDWNLMGGASIQVMPHLSVTGSLWISNLSKNNYTRFSLGLSGSF